MESDESGFLKVLSKYCFGEVSLSDIAHNSPKDKKDNNFIHPKSGIETFLYYLGAGIIISTMLWYIGDIWQNYRHLGLTLISGFCFAMFAVIGNFFWNKKRKIAGGILFTCSISVVPIFIWSLESVIGIMPEDINIYHQFHTQVKSGWVSIEILTLAVGFIFLKYRRFPLMLALLSFILYYLSMDIVPLIFGYTESYIDLTIFFKNDTWSALTQPSHLIYEYTRLIFSMGMLAWAFKYERLNREGEDYSFWLYLFGAMMFSWSTWAIFRRLGWLESSYEYLGHAVFDLVYLRLWQVLRRRVFLILGGIGLAYSCIHIVHRIFSIALAFESIAMMFGLLLIIFGIREERLESSDEYDSYSAGMFYVIGSTMFWGMSWAIFYELKLVGNEFWHFAHAAFDFFFMIFGVVLRRKIIVFWGALGFWGYLGHLVYRTFADTAIFPLVLIAFGLLLIAAGVYYSRYCEQIENDLRKMILGKK